MKPGSGSGGTRKPVYVTEPLLPPLAEFIPYFEQIWENKRLTNAGPFHEESEKRGVGGAARARFAMAMAVAPLALLLLAMVAVGAVLPAAGALIDPARRRAPLALGGTP